jgi:hypothetical protein
VSALQFTRYHPNPTTSPDAAKTSHDKPRRRAAATTSPSRQTLHDRPFQVSSFRNRQHLWMIHRLPGDRPQRQTPPRIGRGIRKHLQKERLAHVEAAARREQHSSGREESHRAQVDVLVAAERGVDRGPVLGERRRVEDDGVEGLATALEVAQIVEGVGFDERDIRETIACRVLLRRRSASAETSTAITESARRARWSANEP